MTTSNITIEQLETLATEFAHHEAEHRARLTRLCAAFVRILALRSPERFEPEPRHHGDIAGHWDSSYPPRQVYTERTGPRTVTIAEHETEEIPLSEGFYHAWRRVTWYGGLAVDARGDWWRADETGTGQFGQFAAHPGDRSVDCEISWRSVHADDLTTAELELAERTLRDLAFPLVAERLSREDLS